MSDILAYKTQHDLSLIVTLYASERHIVRRTFYLRNLEGDSLESQIEHANEVAKSLAQEIYHITCVGLDKVVVKAGRRKVGEFVFDMKPHSDMRYGFYYAVKLTFNAFTYKWIKEGEQPKWSIPETVLNEAWHRIPVNYQKMQSFILPCRIKERSEEVQKQDQAFFHFGQLLTRRRKRRRKAVGWFLDFDADDPIYQSFLSRFYVDGNISLGGQRVFAGNNNVDQIIGVKHPLPKTKPKSAPRKSRLASQPSDDTEYVYIIQMGRQNIFKIGKSNDPQGRLTSLQTSSPYKLKLFHSFEADNASAAEESLHEAFHGARMEGEWFRLSNQQKSQVAEITRFDEGKFILGEKRITIKELKRE